METRGNENRIMESYCEWIGVTPEMRERPRIMVVFRYDVEARKRDETVFS